MTTQNNIQNMNFFSEVPFNLFDEFDLPVGQEFPQPPLLVRTHKARCPVCGIRTHTTNPEQRSIHCYCCKVKLIVTVQSFQRGRQIRKRFNYLSNRELLNRWFIPRINGSDLSQYIMKFL